MKRVWKKSSYSLRNWTYPRLTELQRGRSCGGLDGGRRAKPHSKHSTAAWTAASSLSTSPAWQKRTDLKVLGVSVSRSRVGVEESAAAAGGWQRRFRRFAGSLAAAGHNYCWPTLCLKGPERSSRRSTTVPHCVCLGLDVWRWEKLWKGSGTWSDSEWIIYARKNQTQNIQYDTGVQLKQLLEEFYFCFWSPLAADGSRWFGEMGNFQESLTAVWRLGELQRCQVMFGARRTEKTPLGAPVCEWIWWKMGRWG